MYLLYINQYLRHAKRIRLHGTTLIGSRWLIRASHLLIGSHLREVFERENFWLIRFKFPSRDPLSRYPVPLLDTGVSVILDGGGSV